MMTPALSRRLAAAFNASTTPSPFSLAEKGRILDAAKDAENFSDLPSWVQRKVRKVEAAARS